MELLAAVRDNEIDEVNQILLNPHVNVNITDIDGNTPLILAAEDGVVNIGQRLIQAGANVNQTNNDGQTPLIRAIISNSVRDNKPFIILLLEQPGLQATRKTNIDINAKTISNHDENLYEKTALSIAVYNVVRRPWSDRELEVVELLLESGADPNIPADFTTPRLAVPHDFNTPLNMAVRYPSPKLLELLLTHGADINQKGIFGYTPLMSSLLNLRLEPSDKFKYLLTVPGIDVDAIDDSGQTALIIACRSRHGFRHVDALIKAGADPFLNSTNYITAKGRPTPIINLMVDAQLNWRSKEIKAQQDLTKKFMVARRLRQGADTTEGTTLQLPSRDLSEGIIRKAEYDNLCIGLQNNLSKPGVIALAKSLKIPTTNKSKIVLCGEIAGKLII